MDAANLTTFEVVIAGVPLRLRTSHPRSSVDQLVTLVDEKIQKALHATKSGSLQNAAILAALNLAEDLFVLKNEANQQLSRLEALTESVLNDLEASRLSQAGLNAEPKESERPTQ